MKSQKIIFLFWKPDVETGLIEHHRKVTFHFKTLIPPPIMYVNNTNQWFLSSSTCDNKGKKDVDVWFRFVTVAAAVGFLVSDDFLPLTNLRWWIHKPADHIFDLQRRPVEPAALQVNKRQGQIHWASHMFDVYWGPRSVGLQVTHKVLTDKYAT